MTSNDLIIKSTFNLVTKTIDIEDITDYTALGVNNALAFGFLKIEYNVGSGNVVLYNNLGGVTPDIDLSVTTDATPILYPLDSNGNPLPAQYTITYNYINNDPLLDYDFTKTFTYTYEFTAPEICISGQVNCLTSTIKSTDLTDYNSVAYATLQLLSRTHTLYPPPTSGLPTTSNSLNVLTVSPVYTTTWTSEIVSEVTYLKNDGLYIFAELSGTKEIEVVCDVTLSKILCCLYQVDKNYNNYLCKNPVKATNYAETVVIPTWRYLVLYLAAITAGNATKAADAYAKVLEYSGCDDCDCTDDVTLVVPSSGGGGANQTYSVTSPDNSIDVVTVVVGSNTEFQIQVSPSITNIINNLGNAISVVSGDAYINVVASGSNPKVFTVTWSGPPPHEEQLIQKQFAITLLGGTPYLDLVVTEINNVGPDVAPLPHSVEIGNVPVGTNQSTDLAQIKVSGFLAAGAPKNYIAQANIIKRNTGGTPNNFSVSQCQAEVFWNDSPSVTGECYIRFINSTTGFPITNLQLLGIQFSNELQVALNIIVEP